MGKARNGNRKCVCGHFFANHSMVVGNMHCYKCNCPMPKTSATVRAEKWDAWLKKYLEEHKKVHP